MNLLTDGRSMASRFPFAIHAQRNPVASEALKFAAPRLEEYGAMLERLISAAAEIPDPKRLNAADMIRKALEDRAELPDLLKVCSQGVDDEPRHARTFSTLCHVMDRLIEDRENECRASGDKILAFLGEQIRDVVEQLRNAPGSRFPTLEAAADSGEVESWRECKRLRQVYAGARDAQMSAYQSFCDERQLGEMRASLDGVHMFLANADDVAPEVIASEADAGRVRGHALRTPWPSPSSHDDFLSWLIATPQAVADVPTPQEVGHRIDRHRDAVGQFISAERNHLTDAELDRAPWIRTARARYPRSMEGYLR